MYRVVVKAVKFHLYIFLKERDLGDEYGWKQVHGDVFRPTTHRLMLCSLIGTGYHLSAVALVVISMSMVGDLYTE